jgi:Protein kinase domain/Tetratricopeptide repeat
MGGIATGSVLKRRYRLERLLGRGGMAAVWLGHDEVLDRPVAVKVLSDTIASDPDFLARFRREAKVAAGLSHPNLVGVYDYSESDERPYLVMEFVPGEDLGTSIARGAGVDRDRLARELLGAVAHIHAARIVHRDIKPQNVLIAAGGAAKLIDFGIALPRDATSLTQTGLILATRRYAAPEVMAGQPATVRSDLFSCGVVLGACGGAASPALETLITRLTRSDPGSRPGSAREALLELEDRSRDGERTQAFQPEFLDPPTRVVRSSGRRRKRWGAAAAIFGALGALVVAMVAFAGSGSQDPAGTGSGSRNPANSRSTAKASVERLAEESSGPAGPSGQEATPATSEASPPADPVASGTDPALGSSLNEEGFELIQEGRYEEAVPVLEEAVRAFPPGTEDTNYAYALFNLGDALLRSGRPEEAIPVLERRLEIPNQTVVVGEELEAARAEAG